MSAKRSHSKAWIGLAFCNRRLLVADNLVSIDCGSCLGSNIGGGGKDGGLGISSSSGSLIGFPLNALLIGSGLGSSRSIGGSLGSPQVANSGIAGLFSRKLSGSNGCINRGVAGVAWFCLRAALS